MLWSGMQWQYNIDISRFMSQESGGFSNIVLYFLHIIQLGCTAVSPGNEIENFGKWNF